ncbi:MAG: 4-(cytidine 5'-diphospho)-2-C-methyl-D-erythritol kinase [Clostridiaceae bacterium]
MIINAYGKINLSLDVIGKREDGYHLLKMIMQSVDLHDVINIDLCKNGICVKTNKNYLPVNENNLAYKAAELFFESYGIKSGANIYIEKNIPVAAGMAGGSADAAAVLKALNKLTGLNLKNTELMDLGLSLGADIPYCIVGGTQFCQGIGEEITPLKPFRGKNIIIVKPPFGVSTKEVYGKFDVKKIHRHPNTQGLIKAIEADDIYYISKNMKNVLENVTLKKYKTIDDIKKELIKHGALGSLMSGSGPTVFGIFDQKKSAEKCYKEMEKQYEEVHLIKTI